MTAAELPPALVRFLETSIPSFAAAEVLLFLAEHSATDWSPESIAAAIKPTAVALPEIEEALALFRAQGLVCEEPAGRFRYAPANAALDAAVQELARAYRERPVTLIRTIYALADLRIQSFADAFRLKKKD